MDDRVVQVAVRSPPPATEEERADRARQHQRAYKARLKASGWIYSPVFCWARPDDEQCAMLKRYRAAGGAFSHPVAGIFLPCKENTPTSAPSNKDDEASARVYSRRVRISRGG